jgi:hypothetical protein
MQFCVPNFVVDGRTQTNDHILHALESLWRYGCRAGFALALALALGPALARPLPRGAIVVTVVAQEHVSPRIAVNVECVKCRGEYVVRCVWTVTVLWLWPRARARPRQDM